MTASATLFALNRDQAKRLFSHKTDDALRQFIVEDLPTLDEMTSKTLPLDATWQTLQRCLADGGLTPDAGVYPLNHCLLGGRQLYRGDDWIVSLKRPDMTGHIAEALTALSPDDLLARRQRFEASDIDDESLWRLLEQVREFYQTFAPGMYAVLFTTQDATISK